MDQWNQREFENIKQESNSYRLAYYQQKLELISWMKESYNYRLSHYDWKLLLNRGMNKT